MSRCVKTRSSAQCQTHHQKMMKKFITIDSIISHYLLEHNLAGGLCKNFDELHTEQSQINSK